MQQDASIADSWAAYARVLLESLTAEFDDDVNVGDFLTAAGEAAAVLDGFGQSELARQLFDRTMEKWPTRAQGLKDARVEACEKEASYARAVELARQRKVHAPAGSICRTVWQYWEGPRPEWIAACHESVRRHARDVRLLSAADFDEIRGDRTGIST